MDATSRVYLAIHNEEVRAGVITFVPCRGVDEGNRDCEQDRGSRECMRGFSYQHTMRGRDFAYRLVNEQI